MTLTFYFLFNLTELEFSYRSETSSIVFVVSMLRSLSIVLCWFEDLLLKVAAIIPSVGPNLMFYMLAATIFDYLSYGAYKNCYIFYYRLDIYC